MDHQTYLTPCKGPTSQSQATSKALVAGVPLSDILKAAAWKTTTMLVSCYLRNTLAVDAAFGTAVFAWDLLHAAIDRTPPVPLYGASLCSC